jgi:hypothetical protein
MGRYDMDRISKIAAIIGGVLVFIGAIITFDYHFAKADDVEKFKAETIKTMQQLREDWRQESNKQRARAEYDYAVRRMYDLKDLLRKSPNDPILKQDYNDARQRVIELKKRL